MLKFFKFNPVRDLIAAGILLVLLSNAINIPVVVRVAGIVLFWTGCCYFIWLKYIKKNKTIEETGSPVFVINSFYGRRN